MPYRSTADLPMAVKLRYRDNATAQRQYLHVYNAAYRREKNEALAEKNAHAAVKKTLSRELRQQMYEVSRELDTSLQVRTRIAEALDFETKPYRPAVSLHVRALEYRMRQRLPTVSPLWASSHGDMSKMLATIAELHIDEKSKAILSTTVRAICGDEKARETLRGKNALV